MSLLLRRFYNLLFPVTFLLLLPGYLVRMVRRGSYRENFWQHLGFYSPAVRRRLASSQRATWVQAVSVGEMLVALKLVAGLRAGQPDLPLIVSTTTTTGYALARERVPAGVEVLYTPVDLRGAVCRFFDAVQPAHLVIVDGGLWPNQLWESRRRRVPTALVNARLSPRSERRFRRFLPVARALFDHLDLVCVPEESALARWQSLGVPARNILHTGSIKFDDAPAAHRGESFPPSSAEAGPSAKRHFLTSLGVAPTRPILLAGSTHPGEEQIIAEAFLRLRSRFPDLFLVAAPRHVERCAAILPMLADLGLQVTLRTANPDEQTSPPDTLLLNTTGELRDWYGLVTLAFVGKSLCAIGGQNPAEPIMAGVPVVVGPHMENFAGLTAQLLAAHAIVQVTDPAELESECARLLSDPAERTRLVEAAQRQIAVHRGATTRTVAALAKQSRVFSCQTD